MILTKVFQKQIFSGPTLRRPRTTWRFSLATTHSLNVTFSTCTIRRWYQPSKIFNLKYIYEKISTIRRSISFVSAESFRCLGSADQMATLSTSGMKDSSMTKDLSSFLPGWHQTDSFKYITPESWLDKNECYKSTMVGWWDYYWVNNCKGFINWLEVSGPTGPRINFQYTEGWGRRQ